MKLSPDLLLAGWLVLHGGMTGTAFAQSPTQSSPKLSLELNGIDQEGSACGLTFVVRNGFADTLEELAFEFVMFDGKGLVSDMNVFDFGALSAGKTIVKRFRLKDTECSAIGRLLVNGTARCKGPSPDTAICMKSLVTANRTNAEFGL